MKFDTLEEMKKSLFPSIAVVLIHQYDKVGFLSWLGQLDTVVFPGAQNHFFIYDAALVDSERLVREDIQRIQTPMRLLFGQDQSTASMYNALFRSIPDNFQWILLLDGMVLKKDWQYHLAPCLAQSSYGLWQTADTSLVAINRAVLNKIGGFEERYFSGDMVFDDLLWRVKHIGAKVGFIPLPLGSKTVIHKPHMNGTSLRYYAVRNEWLFARLRLSWWQALLYLWPRVWYRGLVKRGFWQSDFRRALRDGWKIYVTS